TRRRHVPSWGTTSGCSSMVEPLHSKQMVRVRFPSPAPHDEAARRSRGGLRHEARTGHGHGEAPPHAALPSPLWPPHGSSSCVATEFVPRPARTRGAGTNSAPIGGMGRQPLTTTSELVAPRPARSVHRTSWARRYEFAAASTPLRPAPSPSRVRPRPGVGVAGCPLLQPVRVRVRAEVVLPGGVRAAPGTNSARGHELGVGVRRTLGRGPRPRPRLRLRPRPYPHRPHPGNDEGRPAVRDGLSWTRRYADAGVSVLRDVET